MASSKMFSFKAALWAVLSLAWLGTAWADGPGLGVAIDPKDASAWDLDISPAGAGLPAGHGSAREGASVYAEFCQSCHGKSGQSGKADELVGGVGTLTTRDAERTVGSFWPYATSVFDYIRRAMPWGRPGTLSDDQLYAVTAWILAENRIIASDDDMNALTLPKVEMPNRNGFFVKPEDWR